MRKTYTQWFREQDHSPDETLVYRAHLHWLAVLLPIVIAVLLMLVGARSLYEVLSPGRSPEGATILAGLGLIFVIPAVTLMALAFEEWNSPAVVVTNTHLIARPGMFRGKVARICLGDIKMVTVRQNIVGALLGYGGIVVHQIGTPPVRLGKIQRPQDFLQFLETLSVPISRSESLGKL